MSTSNYIALLDPSLKNNEGEISNNLGDVIIYDSIKNILSELFPHKEIIRISTHVPFGKKEKSIINNSLFALTGGSNFLTSDIRHFDRFRPNKVPGFYLYPGFKNVILLGNGWVSYQNKSTWATRQYYKRILHEEFIHSVRDNYTLQKLTETGINNTIHTSCPVTWDLNPNFINKYNPNVFSSVLTLTGHDTNSELDDNTIRLLMETGSKIIYFFPQSNYDVYYLQSLVSYKNNKEKFKILPHSVDYFYDLVKSEMINYVGTRLHGGIKALSHNHPTYIISIDSRAAEIKNSINLNVGDRKDSSLLKRWLTGEFVPPTLKLPHENINKWKIQFSQ